ncbi:uncharacterized protein LOC142351950 isoform X2 [Convolutriloba macropyga]|uniref:uncharacterized protein LOC142351950 isoform X2 n=1 Tax=Convolutriloba macropyga TaxID=536237 RepID=UPI003F51D00F
MVAKELKAFEVAMQELMKAKLPLSRKTVERITELGFNALTYFKHVAVIIEKFIQKCKPAYKVCGLYVIDALVRYNIKQKGRKGDVLGPRFVRNFSETFEHVMKCPYKDYPKVIRVLNLWQAKKVYHHDIIQPLLDIVTKVVESKDESRSPSVVEKDTGRETPGDLKLNEGPTTPPTEDFDSYDEDADNVSYFSDDLEQTFEQPRTPPLPEPNSYPLGPGKRSPQYPTTPKQPPPPAFKPLKELSTKTLSTEDLTDDDKLTPTTSENVRKLGELLNVTSCETEAKGAGKNGAAEKTNAAEFLQLLKTVNDEFSQELPLTSTKSDRDARGEDLKSDLESDVMGSSASIRKECVNIPLEYTKTVDMSAFSPISESQDFDGSDHLEIDCPDAVEDTSQQVSNLETPASPGKGNWMPVPQACEPEPDTEPEPGLIEPEPDTDFGRESQSYLSKYDREKEKIKITVHEDESTTVVMESKHPPSPSKPQSPTKPPFPQIGAKAREKAKKLAKNAKIMPRTPRERKRVYREKEVSPPMQLLPSCSDLEESSENEEPVVKDPPVPIDKGARVKGAHKRKKEKAANAMKAKHERNRSSSPEKKKRKKSKKKKRKGKKSKKAKSKHKNSDDDEESSSDNNTPPPEPKKLPTKSLKEELEHVNEKKKKKRKKDNFDVNRELTTDPSVNYGPDLYPKKCIIIYSTVLSISNITDLSFKQMNDLLKVYGTVLSVEMVVSLNKALVNYAERKAACCALVSLRHSHEFGISWAFPKPVSQQPWIEFWDGSVGCCVVPWNQSPPDPLKLFSDGCFIDKATLPPPEEMPKQKRLDKKRVSDHSSSGNQVGNNSTSASSSVEIKRKIAQMIAKSQKAALPQEESPSPPKKSKPDSTSNSSSTFKSSSFAPVDNKSPSTKFNFGWGTLKKSKDSSESKATEVVPASTVSTSSTPISTSSSSKNPLGGGGTTEASSAYNSSMYMNAQYQSYLHSHAAAMYQHLSYQPSMYSYPYNYPYNPQDLAYAYSSGYGNYHQMYPSHTASSTTSNNPYTAFVQPEPSSQPYSTSSAVNVTSTSSFATCSASVATSNTATNSVSVSLQNFQDKFASFAAAAAASSSSTSNYLSNILKSDSSYSTSPMTANGSNQSGAPLSSKWSNETVAPTHPRFSFANSTPTSNSKDVDFRIQGVGARQRQPAVNFSMLSNLVGSTSKAPLVNTSFSFNQSAPSELTASNSNYVPKNVSRPLVGSNSVSSNNHILNVNNTAPSVLSSNVKYFFQAPNFQGETKSKGVSFSMSSSNEKPQDPTEAAISAVKAFFTSSESAAPTSNQINQLITPPKPPPFPPPPTASSTSPGVQKKTALTAVKSPTQPSFSAIKSSAISSGNCYYVTQQSKFSTVPISTSVATPFTSATRISKPIPISNALCPQSSFMDIICNPSAFPIKGGFGIAASSTESLQNIVSVASTLSTPILSVRATTVDKSGSETSIAPSNIRTSETSVSQSAQTTPAISSQNVSVIPNTSATGAGFPPSSKSPDKPVSLTIPPFPKPATRKENAMNDSMEKATDAEEYVTKVLTSVANDQNDTVTEKSNEKYSPEAAILSNDDSPISDAEKSNVDGDALSQDPSEEGGSNNLELNNYFKSVRNETCFSNQESVETLNRSGLQRPVEPAERVPRIPPPPCSFDERPFSLQSNATSITREPVLSPPPLQAPPSPPELRVPPEPVKIRIPIFRPRNPGDLVLRPRVAEQNRGIFPPPAVINGKGTDSVRAPQIRTPPRYFRAPAVRPNFRGPIPDNARASTAGFIDKLNASNESRLARSDSDSYAMGSKISPTSRPLSSFQHSPVISPGTTGRHSFSPSIRPMRSGNAEPDMMRNRHPRLASEDFDVPLEKRAEQILRREMQEALRAIKPAHTSGSSILSRPPIGEFNEFSYSMSVQAKARMGSILDNNQTSNSSINSSNYGQNEGFIPPSTFDGSLNADSHQSSEKRTSDNPNETRSESNLTDSRSTILKSFVKTPHGLYRRDKLPDPRGSVGIDLDLPKL